MIINQSRTVFGIYIHTFWGTSFLVNELGGKTCVISPIGGSIYQKPASMEKPWLGGCSRRLPEENNLNIAISQNIWKSQNPTKIRFIHCDKVWLKWPVLLRYLIGWCYIGAIKFAWKFAWVCSNWSSNAVPSMERFSTTPQLPSGEQTKSNWTWP